jgi:restriction system protein
MQFKDAAYEILKKAGQPLHYKEIAVRAMEAGLLETLERTPEATMGAMLYTDTINPDSRFYRHRRTTIATQNGFLVFQCN